MKLIPYGHMGKKWFNLEDNAKDIYQNNNIYYDKYYFNVNRKIIISQQHNNYKKKTFLE